RTDTYTLSLHDALPIFGEAGRPRAGLRVAPRVPGQEADLRRPEAVAQDVEQGEVLQRVGPDLGLGGLQLLAGHQLGADLGLEDRSEEHTSELQSLAYLV